MKINIAQKGFTLIEVMVVIIIIGIIAAIGMANYMNMQVKAKDASVSSNLHTVQLAIENYKTANDNTKPDTASISVPSNMHNPYNTSLSGNAVINTQNLTSVPSVGAPGGNIGQIGYTKNMGGVSTASYILTATSGNGNYILVITE